MNRFKRESVIFISLFVLLSLSMHSHAWIDHPLEHFFSLAHSSLGMWHPIFLTFGFYLLLGMLRGFFLLVKRLSRKITI